MTINVKFLLKFGSEENIKNLFEKGEIYMNTIQTFKEFDKPGIGDKYEGTVEILNIKDAKLTFKFPDNPITVNSPSMQLWKNIGGHVGNIYSTYAISNLLLKRKSVHTVDKRMLQFGTHCIIIKDVEKFIFSILAKLDEKGITHSHNLVRYCNYSKNNHEVTLFKKSHLLSYQKEHRIIAYTQNNEPLKFEIGSMHDYAEIFSANDIINSLKVDYAAQQRS
ncbi:hypothetical protein [Flavobacterium caeni]|uniref:Uncharacterized protein n=1 Tax=Flavobacterium caeni TaxID=490189 RepID=A0A1G5KNE5_9FLAO|nr:hypothetical protein [Flavobacterium caeni]SCZ01721.1 hypothetical protein SAMN02927903_03383 [Flavobacterium caeni]